ncbi:two-component sensor histidine kinase [Streptomyces roseirectus]|uniref:histidine kinase n=1 Tax=Streptomyces roseirectus TaxID=2768066 RepID=A0A7H0IRL0_9ACTN|nr:histidine kinase [Streptomyces roseirectus]QNP75426.1 two-component sensor histidine kinase [Streptomyces roseirectus]
MRHLLTEIRVLRVREEATAIRSAVRGADPRTARREIILCASAAAFSLMPLFLAPPVRPVTAVLEALWATLLVPARRLRPAAAMLGASALVVGANVWTMAVVPLVVLAAARRVERPWRAIGRSCALFAVLALAKVLIVSDDVLVTLGGGALSGVIVLVLPALAGLMLGRRRPLVRLLKERNAYLEQARVLTDEAARMQERNRIAGEMHDLLGHRLSLISVHAGALELAADRQAPALAGQAELLRTTAGTALQELREILGVLRHTDLAGEERGTREDITALVTESRKAGSAVELDWAVPETTEVGFRTRQAIHRLVREGLTNALKHAAGAPTRVVVRNAGGGVEVSVVNEAPRAEARSQGGTSSGLVGCQERVSLLGGTFEAGALPGGGFRVAAWLPAEGTRTPVEPGGGQGTWAPAPDQVLTWPRVLGSGCLAVTVVLPTVAFLVILLVAEVVR